MNECKNYKSVQVANNHEEFISLLKESNTLKSDKKYIDLLSKEGKENDWHQKAKLIIELLKKDEGAKK